MLLKKTGYQALCALIVCAALAGCSGSDGGADAGTTPDAATNNNHPDAGNTTPDAGNNTTPDAGNSPDGGSTLKACSSYPNPVVTAGSSAVKPFAKVIGGILAAQTTPATLIYQSVGSCVGVNAVVFDNDPTCNSAQGACITGTATAYTLATPAGESCTLDSKGTHVDIGLSDVFALSCPGVTELPPGVSDFSGPVESMSFFVPAGSTNQAFTAEESHFVWGWADSNGLSYFTDKLNKFNRKPSSGTQIILAAVSRLTAGQFKGIQEADTASVITALSAPATPKDNAIGIAGYADYEALPTQTIQPLAFQAIGQKNAYYPNSSATSHDRRNVRDGHYAAFGYLHYIIQTNAQGIPTSPGAKAIAPFLLDSVQGFDPIVVAAKAGLTPTCAMHVKIAGEGAALQSYTDAQPCDCYFEKNVPGNTAVPASCIACTKDADCTGGIAKCFRGVCESGSAQTLSGTSPAGCVASPTTATDFLNACTTSTAVTAGITIPTEKFQADGGLPQPPN